MQAKHYSVVLLTSTLLIAFTSQPSRAFRVFHTPQPRDYSAESFFPNGKGITTLDVVNPDTVLLTHPFGLYESRPYIHQITRGGTDGLLNDLQLYKNEGWTFQKGRDLRGSFNVRRLFACGIGGGPVLTLPTVCGTERIGGTSTAGIGATLELDYRPSGNKKSSDPKPGINNLYWIQRVITNYPPGSLGVHQSYIDNRTGQTNATYPYFGRGSQIGSDGYFGDRPYRLTDLNRNYYWIAELYLAETDKSNSQKVTIYNGVRWGWLYQYIQNNDSCQNKSSSGDCPPPPPPPPPPDPCNGGSGGGGCYRTAATDYSDYREPSAFDSNDANEPQYNYLSLLNFDDVSSTEDQETSGFDFDDTNWIKDQELPPSDKYDDSKSPASVPESTSALGLLALGAWGIVKALKIKKNK